MFKIKPFKSILARILLVGCEIKVEANFLVLFIQFVKQKLPEHQTFSWKINVSLYYTKPKTFLLLYPQGPIPRFQHWPPEFLIQVKSSQSPSYLGEHAQKNNPRSVCKAACMWIVKSFTENVKGMSPIPILTHSEQMVSNKFLTLKYQSLLTKYL